MAKQNGLAKQQVENKGTLATTTGRGLVSTFEMPDNDGGMNFSMLGRLTVFNGSPKQKAEYGSKFNDGDLIDVMEKRKTASNAIVPVHAFVIYQRWDKDAKAPAYTYGKAEKHRVPREDLERGPNDEPPACYEALAVVCLVVGEQVPYLFTFKRTARRAGDDIARHEMRRRTIGKDAGVYQIAVKADKNAAGQDYFRVVLNGVPTDMDDETAGLFATVAAQLPSIKAKAAEEAAKGDGQDDDLPI